MPDQKPLHELGEFSENGDFNFFEPFVMPGGEIQTIRFSGIELPPGMTPESLIEGFIDASHRSAPTSLTVDGQPVYTTDISVRAVPPSAEVHGHGEREDA